MGELVGVLLAAGQGTRFGGNKGLALLPDGVPMAVRSALNLRSVLPQVICVVRPGDKALYNLLSEQSFEVVVAQNAVQGMSASLQAGIKVAPMAAGWMIGLADMPLIQSETYQSLVAAFNTAHQITVPCLRNTAQEKTPESAQYGHPVIFPARFKQALLVLHGDKGAKAILKQYSSDVQMVSVDDPGIRQDFDTLEAFNNLTDDGKE